MNTILKTLHDQAVIYTVGLCGQEHPDGPRPFQEVLDDKFAELVVLECVRHFNEDYQRDWSTQWREDLSSSIKEHFGVEK